MFPILSSPGSDFTTDDLTLLDFQNLVNNGFSETLNLQIGNNSVVTFELGLNDMDVTCEEDFEIVAPNGDYTINGGVFGTPFPIFILDGVTQTGPAFSKNLTADELGTFISSFTVESAEGWDQNGIRVRISYEDNENPNCSFTCSPDDITATRVINLVKNFFECPSDLVPSYETNLEYNLPFQFTLSTGGNSNMENLHIEEKFCDFVANFQIVDLDANFLASLPSNIQNSPNAIVEYVINEIASGGSFDVDFDAINNEISITDNFIVGTSLLQFTNTAINNNPNIGFSFRQKYICSECEDQILLFEHVATFKNGVLPFTVSFN